MGSGQCVDCGKWPAHCAEHAQTERTGEQEQYQRWVEALSAIATDDESLDDALDRVIDGRPREIDEEVIGLAADVRDAGELVRRFRAFLDPDEGADNPRMALSEYLGRVDALVAKIPESTS